MLLWNLVGLHTDGALVFASFFSCVVWPLLFLDPWASLAAKSPLVR